jgi:hypothetical protein
VHLSGSEAVQLSKGDIHLVMSGEEINLSQEGDNSCVIAVTNNAFEKTVD